MKTMWSLKIISYPLNFRVDKLVHFSLTLRRILQKSNVNSHPCYCQGGYTACLDDLVASLGNMDASRSPSRPVLFPLVGVAAPTSGKWQIYPESPSSTRQIGNRDVPVISKCHPIYRSDALPFDRASQTFEFRIFVSRISGRKQYFVWRCSLFINIIRCDFICVNNKKKTFKHVL